MAGWYELKKSRDEQFYFVLKAGNGQTILQSERYRSRASAINGIESVQQNSPDESLYERKVAVNGQPYFNLKAKNHQIIGTSEQYSSEAARENGIASVMTHGRTATIRDLATAADV